MSQASPFIGPDQVGNIYYLYSQKKLDAEDRYAQVKQLGLDEIALRKGHKSYVFVLVDIERGWIVDTLPSSHKECRLSSKGVAFLNQIEIVTCATLPTGVATEKWTVS